MNGAKLQFDGGVFSAEVEGGRSGAEISFTSHSVVATTPAGQLFSVPFARAELELGGASGKMWFCRAPERELTIFSEAPGFADALEQAGRRELGDKLASLVASARRGTRQRVLLGFGVAAAVGLVLLGLLLGLRQAGRVSVQALPQSIDEQLGALALEHMDLGGPVSTDEVLQRAVRVAIARLERAESGPFTFAPRVVESSTVNAFALPGGPIVVFTGLLREAESAEQLAGVLAHEMAHVTRRHGLTRIAQSLGVVSAVQLLFGDVSGVMAVAVEVLREGAVNSYSREQEHEADMDAVQRMRRAGLDPRALADFFELLAKKEGQLPSVMRWLGTHPELAQRVADVRARAAQSTPVAREPLNVDWPEVQRRAGKSGAGE
jgi:beta-barrel assembly-enhancing protease